VTARYVGEHLVLALRLINRQSGLALDAPDFLHHTRALVQQLNDAPVDIVDSDPELFELLARFVLCHSCTPNPCFNSRVNDSSWISSDGLSRFCSMSRTNALPTTTASTNLP